MRLRTRKRRIVKYILIAGFAVVSIPHLPGFPARVALVTNTKTVEICDDVLSIYGDGRYHERDIRNGTFQTTMRSSFPDEQNVRFLPRYWEFKDELIRMHVSWPPGHQPTADELRKLGQIPPTIVPPNWRWLFRIWLTPVAVILALPLMVVLWRDRPFPSQCCQKCGYNVFRSGSAKCPECGKVFEAVPPNKSKLGMWIRSVLDAIWS